MLWRSENIVMMTYSGQMLSPVNGDSVTHDQRGRITYLRELTYSYGPQGLASANGSGVGVCFHAVHR